MTDCPCDNYWQADSKTGCFEFCKEVSVMRSVFLVYGTTCFSVVVAESDEQARGQVDFKVIKAERIGTATIGKVETGVYR